LKLKITALLLCLWLLLCLVPAVSAAGLIEEKAVSLTISSQYDGTPLVGASFSLYRVAEVDERGELNAVPPFEAFDVETRGENDAVWMAVTAALTDYVLQEEVAPYATGVTDANGVLAFPAEGEALDKGLYLVMGDAHGQGEETYETTPFLVMLPSLDPVKNEWVYDVCVNAKHKPLPKDTVSYTVEKVWTDKDHENMRPEYITVTLLRNGEPYTVTGDEALRIWIRCALHAESVRFLYSAHSADYGNQLAEYLSERAEQGILESLVEREVRETLLVSPYITAVDDFSFERSGSRLTARFRVHTVYGTMTTESEVELS